MLKCFSTISYAFGCELVIGNGIKLADVANAINFFRIDGRELGPPRIHRDAWGMKGLQSSWRNEIMTAEMPLKFIVRTTVT